MSLLTLNQVSLNFSPNSKPALDQINYQIHPGDFVILLGSNGSGKSTLLKVLHRRYQPDSGEIHFHEKKMATHPSKEFNHQVAVLTQNCMGSLFGSLTLYENYLLVKQQRLMTLTHHRVEKKFLAEYLYTFNPNLATKLNYLVEQLSGGEKQALALALILLQPPSLLLLDEHTSALDPKTSNQIMQLTYKMITQHHITCILTTHDLDIALTYGNRLLMLREGKVHKTIDAQEKSILSKEQLIKMYC